MADFPDLLSGKGGSIRLARLSITSAATDPLSPPGVMLSTTTRAARTLEFPLFGVDNSFHSSGAAGHLQNFDNDAENLSHSPRTTG